MKKFLFIIFTTIILSLYFFIGISYANYNNLSNTGIDKFNNANYSRIEMMKGYEFANKIKQAVRNKDIYFFANNMLCYPIDFYDETCDTNNHIVVIHSKEQFINLYKETLFTKDFVNNVCNEDLFVSWRGFMMGHGEILFDYDKNDKTKTPKINRIVILNYSNPQKDENISWMKVAEGVYYNPKSYTILTDGVSGDFKIIGNLSVNGYDLSDCEDIAYSILTIKIFYNNTYVITNCRCYNKNDDWLDYLFGSMGFCDDTIYSCYADEKGKTFYKVLNKGDY